MIVCPRCGKQAFLIDVKLKTSTGGVMKPYLAKNYGCVCGWKQKK